MTGHQINSLVGDLVAMAQAMEALPIAEAEARNLNVRLEAALKHSEGLELNILSYKEEIERLHEELRKAEVAKDQAETMFLEADDRTARALDFVKTMFGSAGALIQALEPPRVEPQPEPVSDVVQVSDHIKEPVWSEPNVAELSQGQSEPDPTAQVTSSETGSDAGSTTALTENASPQSTIEHSASPSNPGPYTNRRYINTPGWISRDDWLAGGGTNEDYDWREHSVG